LEGRRRRWIPWKAKKGADREIRALKQKIEENPHDPRLHQRLAEVYLEKGRKEEAVEEFIRAADCHTEAGFYIRAIALYRRILRMRGDSEEILIRLAELYMINGLLGDALAQIKKVIQSYRSKGKRGEILQLLQHLMELVPDNLEARAKFVELLESEGFLAQALDEMLRLYLKRQERGHTAALKEMEGEILRVYGLLKDRLVRQGEERTLASMEQKVTALLGAPSREDKRETEPPPTPPPQEEIDLEATLELTVPVDSTAEETEEKEIGVLAKLREARIYAEQGLFDEAEALYHEILDLDPRHNEALKGLEEVRKRREEMIVPTDPASVFQRLNLLEERTRVEEGASASSSGTMRDGRSHYELATAYRELGLLDECIEELLLATQDPNTALEANKELISCYLAKDDLDRAIIHLREVFKSTRVPKEELAKTIYPLAQALEKRGQKEKALALYKKIEQYCPAYQDVRQRIEILRQ